MCRPALAELGHENTDGLGIEAAFDRLDPFVQGLLGVAGEHRHLLLGQDRAFVDGLRGYVDRRAGDLHAGGQMRRERRASP